MPLHTIIVAVCNKIFLRIAGNYIEVWVTMKSTIQDWFFTILAVLALIFLGILIGADSNTFQGAASGISAIGTLLLAVVALKSLEHWKEQELSTFRAKNAAEIYNLLSIRVKTAAGLLTNRTILREAVEQDMDETTFHDWKFESLNKQVNSFYSEVEKLDTELMARARILGSAYYAQCEEAQGIMLEKLRMLKDFRFELQSLDDIKGLWPSPSLLTQLEIYGLADFNMLENIYVSDLHKTLTAYNRLIAELESFIDFE